MIELYNRNTGEMETVACFPTVTPHFVITKPMISGDSDLDLSEYFNVTHVRSTALALGPFRDVDIARKCAAVMGYLPVPWGDFSMAVSNTYKTPDPAQTERFKTVWNALPEEIHVWRKAISDACLFGEI